MFKEKLIAIDEGRFSNLIKGLNVMDECYNCFYLNPKITDPRLGYRCKCAGSCIAATLSEQVLSYLFWKLGEISEKQHLDNIKTGKFNKLSVV
jgi:hypothetical protein